MNVSIITPMSRPENFFILEESVDKSARPFADRLLWIIVADFNNITEFAQKLDFYLAAKFMEETNKFLDKNILLYFVPSNEEGLSGNPQRNYALDLMGDGNTDYVYFLDDDNIIHPNFFSTLYKYTMLEPNKAIVVDQIWKNGRKRLMAHKDSVGIGGIDTAQILVPRTLIGNIRWEPWNYCADGVFFNTVYNRHMNDFIFLNINVSYYNYLR